MLKPQRNEPNGEQNMRSGGEKRDRESDILSFVGCAGIVAQQKDSSLRPKTLLYKGLRLVVRLLSQRVCSGE